ELASLGKLLSQIAAENLYVHQIDALKSTLVDDTNVLITTGTGSGKTLSFLLPTILNIFREATGNGNRRRWHRPPTPAAARWWNAPSPQFHPCRLSASRPAAMRALLLYPLNALVQDQVENLRRVLDSEEADRVYEGLFSGERVYFGQYNGATPGHGLSDNGLRVKECADRLVGVESEFRDVAVKDRHRLARPLGSELLTRWDMQRTPPDILITNYSMLAVMLVRELESSMFEMTRKWLASNEANRFFLVVDELHSYRGTAGT